MIFLRTDLNGYQTVSNLEGINCIV